MPRACILAALFLGAATAWVYEGGTGRTPDYSAGGWMHRPARANVYNRAVVNNILQFIYAGPSSPAPAIRDAIDLAGSILSTYFDWQGENLSPILVNLTLSNNGRDGFVARCSPDGYTVSSGVSKPAALCKYESGLTPPSCTYSGSQEMSLELNLDVNWFVSSTAGAPDPSQYDMTTIVLYEMLTGLGMETRADLSGYNEAKITSYDSQVVRTSDGVKMADVIENVTSLSAYLTGGGLHFNCTGCDDIPVGPTSKPVLFANGTFVPQHSVTNLNSADYATTNNQLYTEIVPMGIVVHEIGPLMWRMLGTLGYPLKADPDTFDNCEDCVANYYQWCDVDFLFCDDTSLGPWDARECPGDAYALTAAQCGTGTLSTTASASTAATTGTVSSSEADDRIYSELSNKDLFAIAAGCAAAVALLCAICILVYLVVCVGSVFGGTGGRFVLNSTDVDETRQELDWSNDL